MTDYRYTGYYASFMTESKPAGELLQGPDFIIGEALTIEFRAQEGNQVAWLKNRYGAYAGYLDAQTSRDLAIMQARGWTLRALLSFVAYSDLPEPGYYWGQVALVCNDPSLDAVVDPWVLNLGEKMGDGVRPAVALESMEVDRLIQSGGTWIPTGREAMPEATDQKTKTAILKSRRSFSEKIVELGRQRKAGCMVAAWVFNALLIAGVVALVLHWVGVF